MAKVALLTLHRPYFNLGSAMQAYALCRVLRELGHSVELIDYCRPAYRGLRLAKQGWAFAKYFSPVSKSPRPLRVAYLISVALEFVVLNRRIGGFVRRNTPLSRANYTSYQLLASNPPQADVYLTGSDQVWNSVYNEGIDPALYLGFAPADARRVSYAASFGFDELPTRECKATGDLLTQYDAISVRERTGVAIVESLGLSATQVLDPTLLLRAADWRSVVRNIVFEEPFVLLYAVDDVLMDNVAKVALRISKSMGLALYQITTAGPRRKIPGVAKSVYFAGPETFLTFLSNASYVVTNSMHGVALSINMKRQFISLPRARFNGRVDDLLSLFGLGSRAVADPQSISVVPPDINFEVVEAQLAVERLRSLAYLKQSICVRPADGVEAIAEPT